jgi:hypothetical protein
MGSVGDAYDNAISESFSLPGPKQWITISLLMPPALPPVAIGVQTWEGHFSQLTRHGRDHCGRCLGRIIEKGNRGKRHPGFRPSAGRPHWIGGGEARCTSMCCGT